MVEEGKGLGRNEERIYAVEIIYRVRGEIKITVCNLNVWVYMYMSVSVCGGRGGETGANRGGRGQKERASDMAWSTWYGPAGCCTHRLGAVLQDGPEQGRAARGVTDVHARRRAAALRQRPHDRRVLLGRVMERERP